MMTDYRKAHEALDLIEDENADTLSYIFHWLIENKKVSVANILDQGHVPGCPMDDEDCPHRIEEK